MSELDQILIAPFVLVVSAIVGIIIYVIMEELDNN